MKKAAKKKFRNGVTHGALAPVRHRLAPVKKRPRGKPFPKGNQVGLSTRYKKGEPSPNPAGRPSLKKLSEASRAQQAEIVPLEELLAAKLPADLYGRTYAEVHAWKLGNEGLHGNISAIAELADRAEGKPGTSISINENPDPIDLLIVEMRAASARLGPPEGRVAPQLDDEEEVDEVTQPGA